jgi:hypothetical protein
MRLLAFGSFALGVSLAMATLAGCRGPASNGVVPINGTPDARSGHHTFKYTGAEQSFEVPPGVTSLDVIALGAAGASAAISGGGPSGHGGRVYAVIPVQPGKRWTSSSAVRPRA